MDVHKKLYAICEYDKVSRKIGYAYKTETDPYMVCANDDKSKDKLG